MATLVSSEYAFQVNQLKKGIERVVYSALPYRGFLEKHVKLF